MRCSCDDDEEKVLGWEILVTDRTLLNEIIDRWSPSLLHSNKKSKLLWLVALASRSPEIITLLLRQKKKHRTSWWDDGRYFFKAILLLGRWWQRFSHGTPKKLRPWSGHARETNKWALRARRAQRRSLRKHDEVGGWCQVALSLVYYQLPCNAGGDVLQL